MIITITGSRTLEGFDEQVISRFDSAMWHLNLDHFFENKNHIFRVGGAKGVDLIIERELINIKDRYKNHHDSHHEKFWSVEKHYVSSEHWQNIGLHA